MAHRPDGNGKGDQPRPLSVDTQTFDNNWDSIFGKKEKLYDEKGLSRILLHKDGKTIVLWERNDN